MLYKPNKLQLEDKSLGFSKNDVSSYAKKRYFEYLHHYNLSNFSGYFEANLMEACPPIE